MKSDPQATISGPQLVGNAISSTGTWGLPTCRTFEDLHDIIVTVLAVFSVLNRLTEVVQVVLVCTVIVHDLLIVIIW